MFYGLKIKNKIEERSEDDKIPFYDDEIPVFIRTFYT